MEPVKIKKGYYKIKTEQKFFYEFLSKFLDDVSNKKGNIVFKVDEVISLPKYLKKNSFTYMDGIQMFKDIRNQMNILGSLGFSIPVFSLKDFYICDKSFVFFNMQNILPIEENETLIIKHPFVDRSFFSPEMTEIKKLPNTINIKSWMFSAASMISTLLNLKHGDTFYWKQETNTINVGEGENDYSKKLLLLEAIFNTKLYWALERCLYNDFNKRYFYLI